MPIVASRAGEIRRRIAELADPKTRAGAILRLKALGPRVPAHVEHDLVGMPQEVRDAIGEVLQAVDTADARAILRRLGRGRAQQADEGEGSFAPREAPADPRLPTVEARALDELRALPPPRAGESAAVSRQRGEAHLLLARTGSRLARKDLLACLSALGPDRARLYCEAAALIGDPAFLPVLAALAVDRPDSEAATAIATIAAREKLSARSKALKNLEPALRTIALQAIATR